MATREILNQAAQFQNNAGSSGLDLSAMPIKLQETYMLEEADNFNDGVKDPRWITASSQSAPQLFLQVVPNVAAAGYGLHNTSYHFAQILKLTANKGISRIGLRMSSYPAFSAPGNIIVEIRTTSGAAGAEIPTNVVLATANPVAANTLRFLGGTPPIVYFTTFDFPQSVQLQAGISYAIVMRLSQTDFNQFPVCMYAEYGATGGNYPDGRAVISLDAGVSWAVLGQILDFDFQLYESVANTQPIETGGFLQFDYNSSPAASNETIFNAARGSIELETRFICETISSNMPPYSDYFVPFGPAILGGSINSPPLTDADRESRMIWECWINWSPYTGYLAFLPFCYGANGVKYFWMNSASQWVPDPGPAGRQGIFVGNPANIPFTLKCEISGQGVIIKAYKNDNPAQIIFQTAVSPARRQAGEYHLQLAHAANLDGGRTKFDYFKLSGPASGPSSGEVILRRSYPVKTKVTGYRLDRVLLSSGAKINVRLRSADTIDALQAAAFGEPLAGQVAGNIETGEISSPAALFYDVKFEFIRGSPSPELNSFDFITAMAAVEDDQPVILSLDEAGPGLVMATSSEEGASETANTKKLDDSSADSQWTSLSASDSTPVTVQLSFLSPTGASESRNLNAVILRNANLKSLRVFMGSTVLFDGEIMEDDVIIPFPLQSTSLIQIEARTTKTPNQNKKIGELYCGQILVALPNFDSYTPQRELFESGSFRTLGGKLIAYRGKNKYAGKWRVMLTDSAAKDAVELIFKQNPLITFWPEPKVRPRDLFDVGWKIEALPFAYSDVFKNAGHTIEAEVTEI